MALLFGNGTDLDLKERGMGELAGTRQAGGFNLRYADLPEDADLVEVSRRRALALIAGFTVLQRLAMVWLKTRDMSDSA